jgi:hypothetical protein
MDDPALGRLQATMIEALRSAGSVEEVMQRLRDLDLEPALRAWVDGLDPRAVEVAMAIARRWVEGSG